MSLTIVALTSLERDRIADTVVSTLIFARAPERVITDPNRDTKQYRQLVDRLAKNPYVTMTINHDEVIPAGRPPRPVRPGTRSWRPTRTPTASTSSARPTSPSGTTAPTPCVRSPTPERWNRHHPRSTGSNDPVRTGGGVQEETEGTKGTDQKWLLTSRSTRPPGCTPRRSGRHSWAFARLCPPPWPFLAPLSATRPTGRASGSTRTPVRPSPLRFWHWWASPPAAASTCRWPESRPETSRSTPTQGQVQSGARTAERRGRRGHGSRRSGRTVDGDLYQGRRRAHKDVTGLTGGDDPDLNIASEQTGVPAMNRALAKKGIKTDTIRVVNPNSGQVYVLGSHYVVTRVNAGEDGEANTRDDLYTIQRVVDGGHIDPGDIVQLSYRYTDPNYHEVIRFTDPDDIQDFYGPAFDEAGNVQSEITLCAQLAITNGASTILACAVDPEGDTVTMGDYQNALNKFRDEDEIAIIVAGTGAQPIQALVQQHVSAQSNNKYERRRSWHGRIGHAGASATACQCAVHQGPARGPDQPVVVRLLRPRAQPRGCSRWAVHGRSGRGQVGLGDRHAADSQGDPRLLGPGGGPARRREVPRVLGRSDGHREDPAQPGPRGHGVTTDPTSLHTREWNIIGQQDVMVYASAIPRRRRPDRMPIYDTTIVQVKASAEAALVWLVDNNIIRGHRNLKARQIERQPDVIEVRYEWRPAYPLNYIVVRYSIAPETGDITSTIEGTTSF
ncbi:70 KD structural protein of phage I3 [Bixzunavirus I3]|uniref:70 KD structural protein of phage I3 n=1 Tax=Bixzunavirus I3 TaxID=2006137 RepID=Q38369_9CAUD|nr:70 KD structural protein of phage I3 [Bixzunavirus I3]